MVYLTKNNKEKKQNSKRKTEKKKKQKQIVKTNNRWAGWPVFENSLTGQSIDYIWTCAKYNLEFSKNNDISWLSAAQMDLKVTGM